LKIQFNQLTEEFDRGRRILHIENRIPRWW